MIWKRPPGSSHDWTPELRRRVAAAWRFLVLVLLSLTVLAAGGCEGSDQPSAADEQAIRELLEAYLPRLAEAYSTGNIEALRGLAAEKEMASLEKRITEFLDQESRVVAPTLQSFELEQVSIWNYSNAFVSTLEVWDVRVLAAGSEQVTSEQLGQRNRVKYQLKRREEGWQVLHRAIADTFD